MLHAYIANIEFVFYTKMSTFLIKNLNITNICVYEAKNYMYVTERICDPFSS